jgi:hypothetical protein
MKNLDIEKLERKNSYEVPNDFFTKMQENVLKETTQKKDAKIFKLNWAYSVAAAVALLFGIAFFVNQNNNNDISNAKNTIANNSSSAVKSTLSNNKVKTEEAVAYENFEQDLTSVIENDQKNEIAIVSSSKNENQPVEVIKKEAVKNSEIQVDQILANFTSAELADLSKNTEQDIYLDLYN